MSEGLPEVWGARPHDMDPPWPGDAHGAPDTSDWYRAVDVAAPPHVVFRWLCQLRAAPYSYDWVDNLGRRSPCTLTPGLEELERGQRVMSIFELIDFTAGESMTLEARSRIFGGMVVTYRVTAADSGSRLAAKLRVPTPRHVFARLATYALAWGDLIMMRKQLLTLKALAEGPSPS